MSVKIPVLVAGEPSLRPVINFTLTQMADGSIAVEAKHSEDAASQTFLEIGFTQWGQLEVRTRDLHAPHLCEIASVEKGSGVRVVFKSNFEGASVLLAPEVDEHRNG